MFVMCLNSPVSDPKLGLLIRCPGVCMTSRCVTSQSSSSLKQKEDCVSLMVVDLLLISTWEFQEFVSSHY